MKKILILCITVMIVSAFSGCSEDKNNKQNSKDGNIKTTEQNIDYEESQGQKDSSDNKNTEKTMNKTK